MKFRDGADADRRPDTTIRQALEAWELEAVFRFRYGIYVTEMRRPQRYANHQARTIIDPFDTADSVNVAAWCGRTVVGALRLNLLRLTDPGEYGPLYGLECLDAATRNVTSMTTRFMVARHYRGTALSTRLACEVYRYALSHHVVHDFIDCNSHLIPYFHILGYRIHLRDRLHPDYGRVTVMRLDLHDVRHLEEVRSPFALHLRRMMRTHVDTALWERDHA